MTDAVIRAFQAVDQVETKALIEAGLKERFDPYLEDYNLDLNDLERHLLTMFVAIVDDQIAACGGLTLASETTIRITRMSTKLEFRGRGLAKLILERLIFEARDRGFSRVLLETNSDWSDAVRLYKRAGFRAFRNFFFDATLELTEFELRFKP